jgi:NAD(P)-dependent dehydrogenase (short-subunit alcohol dehydrogenase family)
MGNLDGKVALITGGASGMGAETVRRFAREGAKVVIADLQDDKAAELIEELRDAVVYAHTDVTLEADVQAAVDLAVGSFGRLDCVFNNAGIPGIDENIEAIPMDGYDITMDVLVKGVLLGMKHAAPIMKKQRSGSIINTGSVAGLRTGMGPHVYSAAKAAVIHLSRSAAMELAEWGVRVNCICPGGIVTPIFGKAMGLSAADSDRTLEAVTEALAVMQPIQRPGQPADIAAAALWLASEESGFVTGHSLVVDGGLIAGRGYGEAQENWNLFRELMGVPKKEIARPG